MKAYCIHRWPWFAKCPHCLDRTTVFRRGDVLMGWTPNSEIWWRRVVNLEAKERLIKSLIDNALDSFEERMYREEELARKD